MRAPRTLTPLLLGGLVAACAAPTGSGSIDHSTRPDDLILKVEVGGGFVPLNWHLQEVPTFTLYGDGRIVTPGPQIAIYPGPALPNLRVRRLNEAGMQAILGSALQARLSGPDRHYEDAGIADAATTTFTVVADGRRHVTSAYALELTDPGRPYPSSEAKARMDLIAFREKLIGLDEWLPPGSVDGDEPFSTEELRVFVLPHQPAEDPALGQTPVEWPIVGGLSAFGELVPGSQDLRCGTVAGPDLTDVLSAAAGANELTPWRSQGRDFSLVFRPLLPDESGCEIPSAGA